MTKFNLSAAQLEALENFETYLMHFGFLWGDVNRTLQVHVMLLRGDEYELDYWSTYNLEARRLTHDEHGNEIRWSHA